MPMNFKNALNIFHRPICNASKMLWEHINPFHATGLSLYTPSKHEKTSDIFIFSRGVKKTSDMKLLKRPIIFHEVLPILISFVVNVIRSAVTAKWRLVNTFQHSVTFLKETSHLICSANQMTCFYTQYSNGLKYSTVVSIWLAKYT